MSRRGPAANPDGGERLARTEKDEAKDEILAEAEPGATEPAVPVTADLLVLVNPATEQETTVSPAQWQENAGRWTEQGYRPKGG